MIKLALGGACGRMCRTIYRSLIGSEDFFIVFGVDAYPADDIPYPLYKSFSDAEGRAEKADVIIDFSAAAALDGVLDYAMKTKTALVLATTGHSPEQTERIMAASEKIPIFKASNMSLGINLLINLSKEAMKFLGEGYDVEIVETHHNKKLDAPSGTALTLANEINAVRTDPLVPTFGRRETAHRREANEIGIHAVRGGTVVGKHDVMFFGTGEVLKLSHEAESKEVFVRGALRAAAFLKDKKCGFYNMKSIIGDFYTVRAVTSEENVSLVHHSSISPEAFLGLLSYIKEANVNLDMISQNLNADGTLAVSFSLSDNDLETVESLLPDKDKAIRYRGKVKLTTEGAGMQHKSGVLLEVLSILKKFGSSAHAITTSETKITCCVDNENIEEIKAELKKFYGI